MKYRRIKSNIFSPLHHICNLLQDHSKNFFYHFWGKYYSGIHKFHYFWVFGLVVLCTVYSIIIYLVDIVLAAETSTLYVLERGSIGLIMNSFHGFTPNTFFIVNIWVWGKIVVKLIGILIKYIFLVTYLFLKYSLINHYRWQTDSTTFR